MAKDFDENFKATPAKPDSPIFRRGLTIASVPRSRKSTKTQPQSSAGATQGESQDSQFLSPSTQEEREAYWKDRVKGKLPASNPEDEAE